MALNDRQRKKMDQFLMETPKRVGDFGRTGGRRSLLTDELLGQIEVILGTGVLQKYVYTQLNINEDTWDGWRKRGKAAILKVADPEDPTEWEDLSDAKQRMAYLVSIIESSKAKTVTNVWQNMKDLSKTNYKAGEFILRTLGGADFTHAEHFVHHGVGAGGDEDAIIEKELSGFGPKQLKDLEEEDEEEDED